MRRDHRRFNNRLNALRDRIAEWAAQHQAAELERRVLHALGERPRDTDRVQMAVAYALVVRPPGQSSLIEAWIEAHPRGGSRMERAVRDAWRTCTYRLLSVTEVRPGEAFVAEDALSGERLTIQEGTATQDTLLVGDWLLGVVFHVDGEPLMEGTAELLAPAAVPPVFAVMSALGEGDGHGAAWAALTAVHEAYSANPDGQTDEATDLGTLRG